MDLAEPLEQLAVKLSVQPLSDFYDDTDLRYNLDETGEFAEAEDGWPAAAQWFDAAEALRSVERLSKNYFFQNQTLVDFGTDLGALFWFAADKKLSATNRLVS